jgi:tricorn protease
MSGVDWERILHLYEPLVGRVASRSEFSDLLWEMQAELGTSHCYELGGDYRPEPQYRLGFLGADLAYEPEHDAYRLVRILRGDVWDEKSASPLRRPGVNVEEGMLLLAIGGQRLSRNLHPHELLVNQAGQEVQLTVAEGDGGSARTVCVKPLGNETPVRYRDWVEQNRQYVHEKSGGQVGYVHVPDMGPDGYAEFHRYFLAELDHKGLVVDVRFNGGGHVSELLLEKLARRRLGYDLTRWMSYVPYPLESAYGRMVALTNEQAGSDGDIFCHAFKLMKLGKLIGRRTWGGVIGIWPRNSLVDGGLTTQPEFSFWFRDVGWGVENYGTDPDIEVDITPQDFARGADTQLDRAIEEVLKEIEENPPLEPDFSERPRRTLPA